MAPPQECRSRSREVLHEDRAIANISAVSPSAGSFLANVIENALRSQRLEVPDDLAEICEALDINGDGTVNLTEFIASTMDPVRGSYTRRIASNTLCCPDSHAPCS